MAERGGGRGLVVAYSLYTIKAKLRTIGGGRGGRGKERRGGEEGEEVYKRLNFAYVTYERTL